jgi:hypothetical protein
MTADWLNEALAGHTHGAAVTGFDRELIGGEVGFVGELSRLTLAYDRPVAAAPRSVIAKLPTTDEMVRPIALLLGFYEREIRFYEELAGQIELRTPKRYFSGMDVPSGRFVLLLEDLAPGRCGDQLASCSLDEAKLAVTEIAKLHAAWWNSTRLSELTWLPAIDDPLLRQVLGALYQQSWPFFEEAFSGKVPEAIMEIGRGFGAKYDALAGSLAERPRTIVHTDFRLDNMFFDLADGSPFALVDWQIVQRGLGPADVTYFLAGNFPPEVRRRHERDLLEAYHRTLLSRGVTGYDFGQCWEEYRMAALSFFIFLVTGRERVDMSAYGERAQTLIDTILERYTAAILDLDAAEFLPD